MRPVWLIEAGVYGAEADPLLAEVRRQGKCVAPGCPQVVRDYAEAMLAEVSWRPDPVFMLDVCEADGQLWLVEINGFSCSWLYQCDLAAVVAEASGLATQAWERAAVGGP